MAPKIHMIYGPPGTGKTTYLINKLKELLKKYSPREIAYSSYTRKGAYEAKDRAIKEFPNLHEEEFDYFRTLHSLAFKELEINRAGVLNSSDYKKLGNELGLKFTGYYTNGEYTNRDDEYLSLISLHRNNPGSLNHSMSKHINLSKLDDVRYALTMYKKENSMIDFTDMIEMFVHKNNPVPVKIAIIDEAQDLTWLQWKMVWIAFRNCDHIFIAGDDDQAIYEWSGADVEYFLNIRFHTRTVLNKSYRLPENFVDYAKRITNLISKRVSKEYEGISTGGEIEEYARINNVPLNYEGSYLLLARNRTYVDRIKEYLELLGIRYTTSDGPSIPDKTVGALSAYLKIQNGEEKYDDVNKYKLRGFILKEDHDFSKPWEQVFRGKLKRKEMTYLSSIRGEGRLEVESRHHVGTIHSVKGAEADNVVLLHDVSPNVQKNMRMNPDAEHRVYYVGATRARKRLLLVHSEVKNGYSVADKLV